MSLTPRCSRRFQSFVTIPRRPRLVLFSLSLCAIIAYGLAHFHSQAQTPSPVVTVVSAATFEETAVAIESIAAAFGENLATATAQANALPLPTTLGGTRVTIRDSVGVERAAGLFFVAPTQINLQIPAGLAAGAATIVVTNSRNETARGTLQIRAVVPGLLAANGNGQGAAAGFLLRAPQTGGQSFEPLAEFDARQGRLVPRPLQLNRVNVQAERLFLVLFGTGWRRRMNLNDVRAYVGGVETTVTFAGSQPGSAGLDQVNIPLDAALIARLTGRGRIGVAISVAGFGASNIVEIEVAGSAGGGIFPAPIITGFTFEGGRNAALVGETVRIKGSGFAFFAGDIRVRIGAVEAVVEGVVGGVSEQELVVRVPFGAETARVTVTTPQGEDRSPALLPLRTSISGVVEDTHRQPIPGVIVRFYSSSASGIQAHLARTNVEGIFILPDVLADVSTGGLAQAIEIDGAAAGVTPGFPRLLIEIAPQAGRDNQFAQPIALQQAHGAGIRIPRRGLPGVIPFSLPAAAASFAADWLPNFPATDHATSEPTGAAQVCGGPGEITFALPLNGVVAPPCDVLGASCPFDRFYVNQVHNSRTPVKLPPGHFSSTIVQIAPFNTFFFPPATLTVPNSDCLPAGAVAQLFTLSQGSGALSPGRFIEGGQGLVAPDGKTITAGGVVTVSGQYFFSIARPTATFVGRVVEPNATSFGAPAALVPVVGAMVTARGQTAITDGNGAFVLRGVPVRGAADRAALEVTFLRATGRVERALLTDVNLSANQTRAIGDIVLSAPNTNRPPVLIAAATLSAEEGKSTDFNFIAAEADPGQTVAVNLSGAPLAALINRGNNLYTLRVTPGLDDAGAHTLTLTATDPLGLTTTRQLALTVVNANQPPAALAQTVTINEDTPQAIVLTATDADRDALRYVIVTAPQHGRLTGDAPDLRYTPAPNFFGADSFTFKVSDGTTESNTATVNILVRSVNDAPVLTVPGEQRVAPGQTLSFNISAVDVDASDTVTFTATNLPTGAALQPNANNAQFTWTPMMTGVYVVTFIATDNGTPALNATATVAITVGAANQGAWTTTAGPTGGTIRALLANGATVFAGTPSNGIYRSTDQGATWQRASQGLPAAITITSLAAIGNAVFAGTEQGVYRSTDNGASWTAVNEGLGGDGAFGRIVNALAVKGTRLFAGLDNVPNGAGVGVGLYVSADNGQSWQPVSGLSVTTPDVLVASDTAIFVSSPLGIFRSTDDGQTWTNVTTATLSFARLSALAASGNIVFAAADNGLYRSDNNGQSWTPVFTGADRLAIHTLLISGGNLFIGADNGVYALPLNDPVTLPLRPVLATEPVAVLAAGNNVLFAGSSRLGVFRSTDNGRNWAESNAGLTNVQVYTLTALGGSVFAGTDAGIFVTSDRGQTWQQASNGLPLMATLPQRIFTRVVALVTDGTNLYVGLSLGGLYRSRDQGRSWEQLNAPLPLGPGFLQSLGVTSTTLLAGYATGVGGAQLFRSTDQGQSWTATGAGLPQNAVVAFATLDAKLYAAAGAGVYVSMDDGLNWTAARQGLPADSGVISLLASGTRLFAGTAGRGVFVSNDGGQNWTAANGNLPVNGIVVSLVANSAHVLASVVELPPSPTIPAVSDPRCPDGGVFIDGRCFGTILPGPRQPFFSGAASAFFGRPSRVFISPDNGQSWAPIMAGLPDVPLTVLHSSGVQVFLGTFGGGVFVRQF